MHIPYVHNLDATIHKEFEHRMAGNRAHSSCHYTKFFCISQTPSCVWISSCEHTHHFRNFLLKYYGRVLICATNSTVQTPRAGSLFSTSGVLFTSSEGATLQFRCSHSRLHCSCAQHQNWESLLAGYCMHTLWVQQATSHSLCLTSADSFWQMSAKVIRQS